MTTTVVHSRLLTDLGCGAGAVITPLGNLPYGSAQVAALSSGKILVGVEGLLIRYNADGTLDRTFGGDGIVSGFGSRFVVDGKKIIVAGRKLVRLRADGSVDPTYRQVKLGPIAAEFDAMFLQADHRVFLAADGSGKLITFARFKPNGGLDPTFDGDGVGRRIGVRGMPVKGAFAQQPDGRVVALLCTGSKFTVVRFEASFAESVTASATPHAAPMARLFAQTPIAGAVSVLPVARLFSETPIAGIDQDSPVWQ